MRDKLRMNRSVWPNKKPSQSVTFISAPLWDILLRKLDPWWCVHDFKNVIFKDMLYIMFMNASSVIGLMGTPKDNFDKSTLVQIMAWCHQATSHYLTQCWPRSKLPYGVTKSQWVDSSLAKPHLNLNSGLAKLGLTSLVESAANV